MAVVKIYLTNGKTKEITTVKELEEHIANKTLLHCLVDNVAVWDMDKVRKALEQQR